MPRFDMRWSGWRGISLIAITYVYFLIFAQFAFLKRLAALGIVDIHLKEVMAAMAFGGILFSLLAPRLAIYSSPCLRVRAALVACSAAVFCTLLPLGLASSISVAFLIGCALGLLTVTLVTHLDLWLGRWNPLLCVGIGTGLGYFICNIPLFFTASEQTQGIVASGLCLTEIFATSTSTTQQSPAKVATTTPKTKSDFLRVLSGLTALIWLDSAAFFIIQNTPALKAGTWEGTIHLWTNGSLHFAAALMSVWILQRSGLSHVLSLAFLALGSACLLLLDPSRALLASAFYPVGVSLYSVALVAYPSLVSPATSIAEKGRQAGWIYAIAGWLGSAMGIGMGQNLGHVPPVFVFIAGALILSPVLYKTLSNRRREFIFTVAVLAVAVCIHRMLIAMHSSRTSISQIERGRQVYISEGCINCHSQYVRPNTPDVLIWGPVQTLDELRREHPPLIGNRRQGPDLSQVGGRRSPLWLKAHFYDPSEVSHASFMPSYAYLFKDSRGDDLVAYLQSLQESDLSQHCHAEDNWHPSMKSTLEANVNKGAELFNMHCVTCHAADGLTRRAWQGSFKRLPPNLSVGPYLHLPTPEPTAQRQERIAKIAKFGLPGTDMAGHEYLSDRDIASISLWLTQSIGQQTQKQPTNLFQGEINE